MNRYCRFALNAFLAVLSVIAGSCVLMIAATIAKVLWRELTT